jgi:hypothetical protein
LLRELPLVHPKGGVWDCPFRRVCVPGDNAIGRPGAPAVLNLTVNQLPTNGRQPPRYIDRFRRVSPIALNSGEGLLTEPTSAVRPRPRERVLMPIGVIERQALGAPPSITRKAP